MKIGNRLPVLAAAVLLVGMLVSPRAQSQSDAAAVPIGAKDIGGVVSSPQGREAGVWVIAETTELPTQFRRIVVTDDQGRYLVPDLPQADYSVWVRGYALVDSPKMRAKPGQRLDLATASAPGATDAAHYYPAIYWYSLLTIPDKKEFGGENGIPAHVTQQDWLTIIKNRACVGCHQLGQESTRTIPAPFSDEKTSEDAWMRRVQSGQSAPFMVNPLAGQLGGAPFKYFADWTDRIAQGELPHATPPRPQGMERNLVITEWDWGLPDKYLHDLISSDKRQPTVNANGKLYGSPEYSTDELPILDPATNTVTSFHAPVRDSEMPLSLGDGHAATLEPVMPSAYWGDRQIWNTRVNNHNMMVDRKGRVWLTASVRGLDNPAFCKEGSDHPSAKLFPLKQSRRQLAMLDPTTMKYTFVDTCSRRIICSSASTRTTRCGRAAAVRLSVGSTPRCSTKPETPPRRRAGRHWCSTPTATASGMPPSSRTSRSIRRRTSASPAASTRSCRAQWTVRCGERSACSPARGRSCD